MSLPHGRTWANPDGTLTSDIAGEPVRVKTGQGWRDIDPTLDADEFSNPRGTATARYGWLGGKRRSTDALAGLVLMGMRLYSPVLGRFLQVDPEPGGGANDHDSASQDPINNFDLGGNICWRCHFRDVGRAAWRNKWDIALTAASFIPGAGAAAGRIEAIAPTAHTDRSERPGEQPERQGQFGESIEADMLSLGSNDIGVVSVDGAGVFTGQATDSLVTCLTTGLPPPEGIATLHTTGGGETVLR